MIIKWFNFEFPKIHARKDNRFGGKRHYYIIIRYDCTKSFILSVRFSDFHVSWCNMYNMNACYVLREKNYIYWCIDVWNKRLNYTCWHSKHIQMQARALNNLLRTCTFSMTILTCQYGRQFRADGVKQKALRVVKKWEWGRRLLSSER